MSDREEGDIVPTPGLAPDADANPDAETGAYPDADGNADYPYPAGDGEGDGDDQDAGADADADAGAGAGADAGADNAAPEGGFSYDDNGDPQIRDISPAGDEDPAGFGTFSS